jgi:phage gp46-like protein
MNIERRLADALRAMMADYLVQNDGRGDENTQAARQALAAYDSQTSVDTLKARADALQDNLLLFLLSDDAPHDNTRWVALNAASHHLGSALVYLRRAQGQVVRDSVDAA